MSKSVIGKVELLTKLKMLNLAGSLLQDKWTPNTDKLRTTPMLFSCGSNNGGWFVKVLLFC